MPPRYKPAGTGVTAAVFVPLQGTCTFGLSRCPSALLQLRQGKARGIQAHSLEHIITPGRLGKSARRGSLRGGGGGVGVPHRGSRGALCGGRGVWRRDVHAFRVSCLYVFHQVTGMYALG